MWDRLRGLMGCGALRAWDDTAGVTILLKAFVKGIEGGKFVCGHVAHGLAQSNSPLHVWRIGSRSQPPSLLSESWWGPRGQMLRVFLIWHFPFWPL